MKIEGTVRGALRITSVVVMALTPLWGFAQTGQQVVGTSVRPLPLFQSAGAASPAKTVEAAGFPWPILEEQKEFYRVRVEGADYWVDGMTVRVSRPSSARCTVAVKQNSPVGATPGAGENGCK